MKQTVHRRLATVVLDPMTVMDRIAKNELEDRMDELKPAILKRHTMVSPERRKQGLKIMNKVVLHRFNAF